MAFGFKPDGSALSKIPGIANVAQGVAQRITGAEGGLSSVLNLDRLGSDPIGTLSSGLGGLSSLVKSFALQKPAGGPPYENILEQFASYAPLWTMAALTPNQFNNPNSYRGKPAALSNIVFSSAGRYDSQRVQTVVGAPEYYVNNFEFITTAAASPAAGNTNIQNITFDVYEPYSMGFFIQSCQAAAINAGYPTYNECPFVLKLEFKGHRQDGSIISSSEYATKYFVVGFSDVTFSVQEGGSFYKVKCYPYNHAGYSNVVSQLPVDVTMKSDGSSSEGADNLVSLMSKGTNSLVAALNKYQLDQVAAKQQDEPDIYSIVFPINWTDTVGLDASTGEETGDLLVFIDQLLDSPLGGNRMVSTDNYGDGIIGQSSFGFESTNGGNYNFGLAADVVDPNTGVITRDALTIDPKQRTFSFKQGTNITQVIAQMVLSSEYAKKALDEKNLTPEGMINWFRIDVQIQLGKFDTKRGQRQRKFIYRVMPYLVHNSVFTNSTTAPPGYTALKKVLAKEYNYIYTGQNNDIIKFDIQINSLFHNMKSKTLPKDNENIVNQDLNTPSEEEEEAVDVNAGGNASALGGTGARPVKATFDATKEPTKGGYGGKDVAQYVATQMYNAILDKGGSAGDLVKITFEILGDPYFMVDQGMGNYIGEAYFSPTDQITADQTMNYQGTDSYINVVFRTPIEPNLGIRGQGGSLYRFPDGGKENPFSGIYQIMKVTNRFQDGVFKQTLEANRMPLQPGDFPDGYTPTFKNLFVFDKPKTDGTKGNVVDSAANSSIDLRSPPEAEIDDNVNDFF